MSALQSSSWTCSFARPAPLASSYCDNDGKVPVEGPRNEGLGQPANVGVGPQAVCWEALEAGSEGDGGRERDSDQLHQIQVTS